MTQSLDGRRVITVRGKEARMSDDINLNDLITVEEAAAIRGVSRSAIWDLIHRKRIRRIDRFGRTLLSRSEVSAYVPGKAGRPPKPHNGESR